jgi:hypothetical protein
VNKRDLGPWERAAHDRWLANAAHEHYGRCAGCGRTHDHEGAPLYVARQRRSRVFHCLECWEFGSPLNPAGLPPEPLFPLKAGA